MFSKIRQSLVANEIRDLIQDDLAQVEQEIGLESIASVEAITTINRYLHAGGGKRLRPVLLLLTTRLFGQSTATARRMAAVVEMIHTATLVHDDVIDLAKSRRGRPSANVIWGNHTSVLSGDWLYMQAFQVALRERQFPILDVLISLTQRMVEGELLQLERLQRIDITEADYMELVDRKNGEPVFGVYAVGALSAAADEDAENRLGEFAWNLGMAFQLVDDILDFTSSEKILGKPAGNDLREGKVTLPLIYALQEATSEEREAIDSIMVDGNYDQVPFMQVLDLLERHKSIAKAYERAHAFTAQATELINTFPESAAQRALRSVIELVTDRQA